MGIFIVNCNRRIQKWVIRFHPHLHYRRIISMDLILVTYHFFYSLAHCFYSLIRSITIFALIKFYFKKARVFLYIKGSVIVKSNLPVDPCIDEWHVASVADPFIHVAFNLSRFVFIEMSFHGIIMTPFAVADIRIPIVIPSAWRKTGKHQHIK